MLAFRPLITYYTHWHMKGGETVKKAIGVAILALLISPLMLSGCKKEEKPVTAADVSKKADETAAKASEAAKGAAESAKGAVDSAAESVKKVFEKK